MYTVIKFTRATPELEQGQCAANLSVTARYGLLRSYMHTLHIMPIHVYGVDVEVEYDVQAFRASVLRNMMGLQRKQSNINIATYIEHHIAN